MEIINVKKRMLFKVKNYTKKVDIIDSSYLILERLSLARDGKVIDREDHGLIPLQ